MSKTVKKPAMGRGLAALLKDPENDIQSVTDKNAAQLVGNIVEIDLDAIEVSPFQPRSNFNEEHLQELASSIKELGLIQPITVRKIDFNKYQLISGERRLRAATLVGLNTVPAYIRIANDNESLVMALVENIQRHDLDPIEIALSYQRLMDEIELTQEQVSERVGKKRSTIANYLRLLKLDPIIQTGIRDGFISMGHGRAIINIEDHEVQTNIYQKIVSQNLSVRDTEALVKGELSPPTATEEKTSVKNTQTHTISDPQFVFKEHLSDRLATKVDIKKAANGSGSIVLKFSSENDLNRIIELLNN